jgi:hypothetical protein
MKASRTTIELPFDGRSMTYDRDKLATALLVRMEIAVADDIPSMLVTRQTAVVLRNEHGFDTDAIVYAIGARTCDELNIDPYRGLEAVTAR